MYPRGEQTSGSKGRVMRIVSRLLGCLCVPIVAGLASIAGSAPAALGATSSAFAPLAPLAPEPPPPPTLEQVDFKENIAVRIDHQKNEVPEKPVDIEEVGEKNEVEWQKAALAANTKNWPVAYVKGKTIKLVARFKVEAATREFIKEKLEGEIRILGRATIGGVAMTFTKNLTKKAAEEELAEHETYLTTGEIVASAALPNRVFYELSPITWEWIVQEKGVPVLFIQPLGISMHNFYTTNAAPLKSVVTYLTLLDLDTLGIFKEGKQPPAEADAIKGVWSEFKTRKMELRWYGIEKGELHRGGKVLKYYKDEATEGETLKKIVEKEIPRCEAGSVKALLEEGAGQCGAWGIALSNAFGIEGVTSALLEIVAKFGAEGEKCAKAAECNLLVKEWEFVGEGKKEARFPYTAEQIKDLKGIPAQGTSNPPSTFNNHYIVEAKKGAGTLYDPSYGAGPYEGAEALKAFQVASIAGFCIPFKEAESECQKAPAALQVAIGGTDPFE
jgi:hypothetical protein